ncbi:hypothetical protein ACSYAD_13970 [Acaryochloris marina NIES-2412]|uniref:hypothetical protein n=1 Tax=Acaryochloris marina TaxID=155978 RepID=UPI00405A3196
MHQGCLRKEPYFRDITRPKGTMPDIKQTLIPLSCLAALGFSLSSFILNADFLEPPSQYQGSVSVAHSSTKTFTVQDNTSNAPISMAP